MTTFVGPHHHAQAFPSPCSYPCLPLYLDSALWFPPCFLTPSCCLLVPSFPFPFTLPLPTFFATCVLWPCLPCFEPCPYYLCLGPCLAFLVSLATPYLPSCCIYPSFGCLPVFFSCTCSVPLAFTPTPCRCVVFTAVPTLALPRHTCLTHFTCLPLLHPSSLAPCNLPLVVQWSLSLPGLLQGSEHYCPSAYTLPLDFVPCPTTLCSCAVHSLPPPLLSAFCAQPLPLPMLVLAPPTQFVCNLPVSQLIVDFVCVCRHYIPGSPACHACGVPLPACLLSFPPAPSLLAARFIILFQLDSGDFTFVCALAQPFLVPSPYFLQTFVPGTACQPLPIPLLCPTPAGSPTFCGSCLMPAFCL